MYCAVIISCLIAVGYAGTVSPVYYGNRETRQATTANTNLAQNNKEYFIEGFKNPTPKQNPEPTASATAVAATESPSILASLKPAFYKFAAYGKHAGNYLLQTLGVVYLTTSAVGLVCSYTTACDVLLYFKQSGARRQRRVARSYSLGEYPYLDELTKILISAMDNYANTANMKQKREVGQ